MLRVGRRGTLRLVLRAAFGLTLGLWLLAGYQVLRQLDRAEEDVAVLNARYVRAQEVLTTVRAQVLEASVFVRDALLQAVPRPANEVAQEVERAYGAIDKALISYVPVLGGAVERREVARLRQEIQLFRAATLEAVGTDSRRWQGRAPSLLQQFLPNREAVLAVSEELQALNRATYLGHRNATARMQAETQRQVLILLGAVLAMGMAIAVLSYRYATHLERQLNEQRTREQRISSDLQRLSGRLVHAQEEERRRVARELHDEVGQALSALNLELTVAQRGIERWGAPASLLSDARALSEGALRHVRNISQLLHPSALDDLGLTAALQSYLRGCERRTGLSIDFRGDSESDRMPVSATHAIYRITQEAMTNIAKHAAASRVSVRLTRDRGHVLLAIEDDGIGFEPHAGGTAGRGTGLGLIGIEERARQLGGRMRIDAGPGRGTKLTVELPVGADLNEGDTDGAISPALVPEEVHHG